MHDALEEFFVVFFFIFQTAAMGTFSDGLGLLFLGFAPGYQFT